MTEDFSIRPTAPAPSPVIRDGANASKGPRRLFTDEAERPGGQLAERDRPAETGAAAPPEKYRVAIDPDTLQKFTEIRDRSTGQTVAYVPSWYRPDEDRDGRGAAPPSKGTKA